MHRYKPFLPGKTELAMFAVLAVVCAAVVMSVAQRDAGLAFTAFPTFVFCAVLGLWKHGRLRA